MLIEKVQSSQINAIGWENNLLLVKFNGGGIYIYSGVPLDIYEEFKNAPSKGHFLAEAIKPNYAYTKLNG